jgi:hypothetical protein
MSNRVQEKIKAISLRMQGYSYSQIQEHVPVSKGLLSGWFKYIKLSEEQEKELISNLSLRSKKGVAKAAESNIAKRKARELEAINEAKILYDRYKEDKMFIAGLCLYWAEGSKRVSAFSFVNSDPKMINFMIFWMQKYLDINKKRIFLRISTHADFINEKYEDFWSTKTGVPLSQFKKTTYKPNRHGVYKKNPIYKGCVRIEVAGEGMALLRKTIYLYEAFVSEAEMLYLQS